MEHITWNMKKTKGFSILEILVSITIFSLVLLAVLGFVFWLTFANTRAKADANTLENARRILDIISYEIRGAKSGYTPTTTQSQLSLETLRDLPAEETNTFLDFFLCGADSSDICLKKESQNPTALNSEAVVITGLSFSQIANGSNPSIKISLMVEHKNPTGQSSGSSSVTLGSTVSLRNY